VAETAGLLAPHPLTPSPVGSLAHPRTPAAQGARDAEALESNRKNPEENSEAVARRVGQLEQSVARGLDQFNSKQAELKCQMDDIKSMLRAMSVKMASPNLRTPIRPYEN
jgi:hypothetical protein